MLTINKIDRIIEGFFNSHGQINSVRNVPLENFMSDGTLVYPSINISDLDVDTTELENINENYQYYGFEIVVADIMGWDNSELQNEIISDFIQIACDLYAYLWFNNEFVFIKNSNVQKFVNSGGDFMCGIVINIIIAQVSIAANLAPLNF